MTDLFQKMIASNKWFYLVSLTLLACTQPSVSQKNIVSQWLELVHLNHLKSTPFKTLSVGQQRLALIIRAVIKHPIINFRRSRGRTR
jgi:molybdate transport system ATP-binding protein